MTIRKTAYILLISLAISSCSVPAAQEYVKVIGYNELIQNIEYNFSDLPNTGGYSYSIASNSTSIFLPVVYDKFRTYVDRMDIFEYNRETEHLKKIYESDELEPFFIDEIFATNDSVVWCKIYENGIDWSMEIMDLTSHEISTIRDYDSSKSITSPSPVLSNGYLVWYELYEQDDIYNNNSLLVYNMNTKKTEVIDSGVYRSTAYARPSVFNNEVLFLKQDVSEYIRFHVHDFSTSSESTYLSKHKDIVDYSYADGQIIFRLDYEESHVYYYDMIQENIVLLDKNTATTSIRDIGFFHGVPWLLYGRDTNRVSNLYLFDVLGDKVQCITENTEQVNYAAPENTVNGDLSLIYYDEYDELHYCTLRYLEHMQ